MKSFIYFFFLIHSVRITDFDNYLSFVPNCTSLHHVFLKGFLRRLIQKMLLSVFIIQTGQWVTHVQNIACTYDTFLNFEYTHLAHWVLCGEFCFASWGKSWKHLNYRSNLNVIFNVAIQVSSERHSRKWSFNRN